jgi:hydrogenase maturation protease
MNRTVVERIADAVLYEGYILYPYRPSVKNRQRWTFGGLYPEAYCQTRQNGDASGNQTECLVHGGPDTVLNVTVRFLHLTTRQIYTHEFRPVETLRVGNRLFHTWQEAEERTIAVGPVTVGDLLAAPRHRTFTFSGSKRAEPITGPDGETRGGLVREQQALSGDAELSAVEVVAALFRITLRVANCTPWPGAAKHDRDDAVLRSLASTHAILGVRGGEFVSLLDPPEIWRDAAAVCRNVGLWPVLVGDDGQTDTMLASPIILCDYPQVAPESPGDFFDGAEIDEMLALRIITLTDEEKQSMAAVDTRAGALLARTEALAREQLLGLHGRLEAPHG